MDGVARANVSLAALVTLPSLSRPVPRSTWGYELADIVGALRSYCERTGLDPKTTYVWICCACINQHRVKEKQMRGENVSVEEFQAVFDSRIEGTGHVLSLLVPWRDPENLKRSWVSHATVLIVL